MTEADREAGRPPAALDRCVGGHGLSRHAAAQIVTVYLPLFLIMVVLLFPFYWMALTAIKPDEQLIDIETYNPFFVVAPTLKHINKLLFETAYPRWLWNTMYMSVAATVLSLFASVLAAYASCASATAARMGRRGDLPRLSRAALDPVHPARDDHPGLWAVRQPDGADPRPTRRS